MAARRCSSMLKPIGMFAPVLSGVIVSLVPARKKFRPPGCVRIGKRKPSSGTSNGGSICFCAACMIVFDMRLSIFTSGRAVIAGERPIVSPVAFKKRGTTYGSSSNPPSLIIISDFLQTYTDMNGMFKLSGFVTSLWMRGETACRISTSSSGFFSNVLRIKSPTLS